MSDYKNPKLAGEEHIARHVHDFSKCEGRYVGGSYGVWWDGLHFSASSTRRLIEQILQYEADSRGI